MEGAAVRLKKSALKTSHVHPFSMSPPWPYLCREKFLHVQVNVRGLRGVLGGGKGGSKWVMDVWG